MSSSWLFDKAAASYMLRPARKLDSVCGSSGDGQSARAQLRSVPPAFANRSENGAGSVGGAASELSQRRGARCAPLLPSRYEAHSVWAFTDPSRRFSYAFNRVYKRSDRLDSCGPICLLDEDLSYWVVSWISETGDSYRECRSLSYAQARKLRQSRLTFGRFSSLLEMRDELFELLHVGDVMLEQSSAMLPEGPRAAQQERPV